MLTSRPLTLTGADTSLLTSSLTPETRRQTARRSLFPFPALRRSPRQRECPGRLGQFLRDRRAEGSPEILLTARPAQPSSGLTAAGRTDMAMIMASDLGMSPDTASDPDMKQRVTERAALTLTSSGKFHHDTGMDYRYLMDFGRIDKDHDYKISEPEYTVWADGIKADLTERLERIKAADFTAADLNRDGKFTFRELKHFFKGLLLAAAPAWQASAAAPAPRRRAEGL